MTNIVADIVDATNHGAIPIVQLSRNLESILSGKETEKVEKLCHDAVMRYVKEHDSKKLTFKKDFERLVVENDIEKISKLLDEDDDRDLLLCKGTGTKLAFTSIACFYGKLDVVKLFVEKKWMFTTTGINLSAMNEHLEILKHICENFPKINCDSDAYFWGAVNGNMDILKFLRENFPHVHPSKSAMDLVAQNGNIDALIWLHENFPEVGCTENAMYWAAGNGHLNIVTWLDENFPKMVWSARAIELAENNGHGVIVKYLQYSHPELIGCTPVKVFWKKLKNVFS